MKKLWLLGTGLVLVVGVVGCRPELAQSTLTPKEEQWESFIQEEYPSWKSPRTYPESVRPEAVYTAEETLRLESELHNRPAGEPVYTEYPAVREEYVLETISVRELPPPPEVVTYKVLKGDTLSGIALKYYGNARSFNKILEANPALNGNPNRLRAGQELVIPNPTHQP